MKIISFTSTVLLATQFGKSLVSSVLNPTDNCDGVLAPRAFISYAWTSIEHKERVRRIAERLMQDGVDVVLDQWDLKPGHDANAFMERSVTDGSVTKVIIFTDKKYQNRADQREAGVGAEAQIMSPEIYGKIDQEKFGIAVTEFDDDGQACVPAFVKGRVYFNFSDQGSEETEYEKLLRWLHNRPSLIKPNLGHPPAFLDNTNVSISLTYSSARRLESQLRSPERGAPNALKDYGENLLFAFKQVRPKDFRAPQGGLNDQPIFDAIAELRPLVLEFKELSELAAKSNCSLETIAGLCEILESLATTTYPNGLTGQWYDVQFDAHRFATYEAFMSLLTAMIRNSRFEQATKILETSFYIENKPRNDDRMSTSSYTEFCSIPQSFDARNRRLKTNFQSPISAFLKDHVDARQFEYIMQTDLILYLRYINCGDQMSRRWIPLNLIYAFQNRPFEIFARSESKQFCQKICPLFAVSGPEALKALINETSVRREISSTWDVLPMEHLTNLRHLASKP